MDTKPTDLQYIIWRAYNITTGQYNPLIYELSDGTVGTHQDIPAAYVKRVEKKGQATLVIKNVNFKDSTNFRCVLQQKVTAALTRSTVKLVVIGMLSAVLSSST